jgi:hypothetical protein
MVGARWIPHRREPAQSDGSSEVLFAMTSVAGNESADGLVSWTRAGNAAAYECWGDAFLHSVHAEAALLQLDEAESPLLLPGEGFWGLLQIVFAWSHDRTSLGESQVKGGASKARPD